MNKICDDCGGFGKRDAPIASYKASLPCSTCKGSGYVHETDFVNNEMEVTVRIPEGDKCYEDIPRYLCPFFTQNTFDYELIGHCGYLRQDWKIGGIIKHTDDFQKHPQCPNRFNKKESK